MDLPGLPNLVELYGLPGLIIGYLIWENRALKSDVRDLNSELRQTLAQVFPVIETLKQVLGVVQGGSK